MENYIYTVIEIESNKIIKREDSTGIDVWIPMDEANSDYQAYLRWLEETN